MIWLFLIYGLRVALCFHTVIYEYHFINVGMTWDDAQQYCRQYYSDLATIWSTEDLSKLNRPSSYTGLAWIGLFDDLASWYRVMGTNSNSWRWSATGNFSTSRYQSWSSGEPNYAYGIEECVIMLGTVWGDTQCTRLFPFVCFTGLTEPGSKNYTFVSTAMSWEDAQAHCRQNYTDLAMIEDASENAAVDSITPNLWVWIGLYRQPWRWSDGSNSSFTKWMSGQPNNYANTQHCVWEDNAHEWNDVSCSVTAPFICQQGKTSCNCDETPDRCRPDRSSYSESADTKDWRGISGDGAH